jgi:hypothetical protein
MALGPLTSLGLQVCGVSTALSTVSRPHFTDKETKPWVAKPFAQCHLLSELGFIYRLSGPESISLITTLMLTLT